MTQWETGSTLMPRARKSGDAVIVSVQGEIDLHNSPELRTQLLGLLAQHNPGKLVINLSQVPYMDSSAVAVLIESLQKMRKTGGRVFLTDLQPRVRGLLEIARLETIFGLVNDEQEALAK